MLLRHDRWSGEGWWLIELTARDYPSASSLARKIKSYQFCVI
ncbi:hypothetical protein [Cylindrospermum stagnale]|nr:hypothetical protein [Cylindrospermum stagnale]